MSLTWQWSDFWDWFEQSDTVSKRMAWSELVKDNWLGNASANVQWEVLRDAPMDVKQYVKSLDFIKPRVKVQLVYTGE